MANSKRIESLDIAKGIGILIVVFGHVLRIDDVFLKEFIFSFHMPLFFILSGFVLKTDNVKGKAFLGSELKLLSSYIIYGLLYLLINVPLGVVSKSFGIWDAFMAFYQLLVLYGRGPLWFLTALMFAHIGCKILKRYFNDNWALIVGLLLLLLSEVIRAVIKPMETAGIWQILYYPMETFFRGFGYTFFCMAGYCFKKQFFKISREIEENKINIKLIGVCILMTCMILVNVLCVKSFYAYDTYTLADVNVKDLIYVPVLIIMAITGSISVLGISLLLTKWKLTTRVFTYFGINSLFIMATHLQFYICAVARKITGMTINSLFVSFLIVVAIEVVLITILNRPLKYFTDKISNALKKLLNL